jgi:hypothetical protein
MTYRCKIGDIERLIRRVDSLKSNIERVSMSHSRVNPQFSNTFSHTEYTNIMQMLDQVKEVMSTSKQTLSRRQAEVEDNVYHRNLKRDEKTELKHLVSTGGIK